MDFRGQVWKQVWKMFWSEFGESGGTPPPRIPRSTPPPPPPFPGETLSLWQRNYKLDRVRLCRDFMWEFLYIFWDRRSLQIRYAVFSLSMVLSMLLNVQIGFVHLHFSLRDTFPGTLDVARVIRVTSGYKVRNLIWCTGHCKIFFALAFLCERHLEFCYTVLTRPNQVKQLSTVATLLYLYFYRFLSCWCLAKLTFLRSKISRAVCCMFVHFLAD